MSKVLLSEIAHLTFYKDRETIARRTEPVPQLQCVGNACRTFQPDVVQCTNAGGEGTDVDWACEAELPDTLHFGTVEVGCEGWSEPGDAYVLEGSCSLEYSLIRIPGETELEVVREKRDPLGVLFAVVWVGVLGWILWGLVQSCLHERRQGPHRDEGNDPPYQDEPSPNQIEPSQEDSELPSQPDVGLAALPQRRGWDWESVFNRRNTRPSLNDQLDNSGEGSSSGAMRSSMGLGSSRVR